MKKIIQFSDVQLEVCEHPEHEWTLTTKQVAEGYGVSVDTIQKHQTRNGDDLREGKHWVTTNCRTLGGVQRKGAA